MRGQGDLTTIEGIAVDGVLHPVLQAFIEHDALFCTPGQIMSAIVCIAEGHAGHGDELREFMSGNICRCAAYPNIVAAVDLPPLPAGTRSRYLKMRDRESYEFALASTAVAGHLVDGVVGEARIALGGAATKPWRPPEAERALIEHPPSRPLFAEASAAAVAGAAPLPHGADHC